MQISRYEFLKLSKIDQFYWLENFFFDGGAPEVFGVAGLNEHRDMCLWMGEDFTIRKKSSINERFELSIASKTY